MSQPNSQRGFTLIELMLSMTFVSVLLLAIAMTVIQMGTIYNRGMTLKELNQTSRDIADDLRRTVASSELFTINTDGSDSANYVTVKTGANIVGGRLCTGSFTYIWNIAKAIEGSDANATKVITSGSGTVGDPIRFVRVPDTAKKYCAKASGVLVNKNIAFTDSQTMVDLLKAGDHSLALQRLTVSAADSAYDASTNQRLYMVNYTLGTGATSAMDATQSSCLPPGTANSNITYCNVQAFSLILRVGNTVN